ncbi:cell adhesion molecule DSCAML1-like [Brevipalpus obovatus]|uniref:cell adhesion molecule DSCAML1-like n=1 Tax=Brevipalpus obovatus TaxID=246614 RepID=UPI003D9F1495
MIIPNTHLKMVLLKLFCIIVEICLVNSNEPPKISPVPPRIFHKVKEQALFSCILQKGSLPVEFQWSKGGDVMRTSGNIVIETSKRISSLVIESLSTSDMGNYSCKASNSFGSDTSTTQLLVEGPPQWLTKPSNRQVGPKEHFDLECNGIGYPNPTVSWRKQIDSGWQDLFESATAFVKTSRSKISASQLNKDRDEGKYVCEVSNGVNPSLWADFEVKISGK